ncbi:MAG: hypothetical protein Q8O42_01440 [Acidobacteriota bacterium]|nr:hypothetical protein [Acidobacteriota bacterium]
MVNPDFRDLFAALNEAGASYLVVGAHAVAFYAEPRYTKDLDIWVDASPGNAPRILAALQAFGAPLTGVTEADFHRPGAVLQIGVEPNRIDVTTQIDGVVFEAAWPTRLASTFGDQAIWIIGRAELIQNKSAAARPQDLLDLDLLRKHG